MIRQMKVGDELDLMLSTEKFTDKFRDFYYTINGERKYFYKFENSKHYLKQTKKGEICLIEDSSGIILTWGISDKSGRVYLKILCNDNRKGIQLLRAFLWKYGNKDFYIRIKNNNSLRYAILAKDLGFIDIKGNHGNDIIFYRKKRPIIHQLLLEKDIDYDLLYHKREKK